MRLRTKARREAGRNVRRVKRRAPGVVRTTRKVMVHLPESVEKPLRKAVKGLT